MILAADPEFYGGDIAGAVRSTSEEGTNGELLGFGVRTMSEANLGVRFIDEAGRTRGGFWALEGDHALYIRERLADYQLGLDVNWRIEIRRLRPRA